LRLVLAFDVGRAELRSRYVGSFFVEKVELIQEIELAGH
jgi:hypothetical protein